MRAVVLGTLFSLLLAQSGLVGVALTIPVSTDCYQINARGQHVGYLTIRSFRAPQPAGSETIITEMENLNRFSRLGDGFLTGSQSHFEERASDGQPLRFTYRYLLSNQEASQARGEVHGQQVRVQLNQAQPQQTETTLLPHQTFSFPTGEGMRQLFKAHYSDPTGSHFQFQTLHLALAPQVVQANAQVGEEESLSLPGGEAKALKRFALSAPQDPTNIVYEWRDPEGRLYKAYSTRQETELLHLPTEALAQLAKADPQHSTALEKPLDTIASTRIRANEVIRNPRQTQLGIYQLTLANGSQDKVESFQLPEDPRQTILQESPAQGVRIQVTPHEPQDALTEYPIPYEKRYLQSTPYLQSEDPVLVQLAKSVTHGEKRAYFAARKLQEWVYQNIRQKDLSQGFASAQETLAQKTGDCTEHAVLLAALARALGIPSRVAVGVLYLPAEGDGPGYFTYHLWTEVFIGKANHGEWVALDASNPEPLVDATHIKLADSDLADINAPVAMAEQLSPLMGRLRINVLQASAPGSTLVTLMGTRNGDSFSLSGSNTLRWDLRDFTPDSLQTYELDTLNGTGTGTLEGLITRGFKNLLSGKGQAGQDLIQKALEQAKTPLEYYHLGERLAGLELFRAADQAFLQAVQGDTRFQAPVLAWRQGYFPPTLLNAEEEARYFQALGAELLQHDPETAQTRYREILQRKPGFSPAALRLARLAMAQRDYVAALQGFAEFSRITPQDPRGPEGEAQASLGLLQYTKALAQFKAALQLATRQPSLQGQSLAQDLAAQYNLTQGRALLATNPANPEGWWMLGHGLLQQKHYRDALAPLNQALHLHPFHPEATLDKFETLIALGEWGRLDGFAKRLAQKITGPNRSRAERLLGYYSMRQRNYPLAKTHLLKAIALDPKAPEAYGDLAQVYTRTGNAVAAQSILRQGISQVIAPQRKRLLQQALATLLLRDHPAEAREVLASLLKQEPTRVGALVTLGQLEMSQNQLEAAKAHLWDALTLDPYHTDALTLLGDLYALEENPNEALYYYRKALKTDPGNGKASQALALLNAQYQLGLKQASPSVTLSDDEADYLLRLKQQFQGILANLQGFKETMNGFISASAEGFSEHQTTALPVLTAYYEQIREDYQQARTVSPPPRFRDLQEHYLQFLYTNLAMIHGTHAWLSGLLGPVGFEDFKQDPAYETYLQAKAVSADYRKRYQAMIQRLEPALQNSFGIEGLSGATPVAPTATAEPSLPKGE